MKVVTHIIKGRCYKTKFQFNGTSCFQPSLAACPCRFCLNLHNLGKWIFEASQPDEIQVERNSIHREIFFIRPPPSPFFVPNIKLAKHVLRIMER